MFSRLESLSFSPSVYSLLFLHFPTPSLTELLSGIYHFSYTRAVIFQCYVPQLLSMCPFPEPVEFSLSEQDEASQFFFCFSREPFTYIEHIYREHFYNVPRPSSRYKCLFFVMFNVIDRRLNSRESSNKEPKI